MACILFILILFIATTRAVPPSYGSCQVFPANDEWNRDISADSVDPMSDCYVLTQMTGHKVHLDMGTTEEYYGIPYILSNNTVPQAIITYGTGGADYSSESDLGPFRIPLNAPIEGGSSASPNPTSGDRHVLTINTDTCMLFELYNTIRTANGFECSSSASFNLSRANNKRTAGWTSADAAGMPIFPGLLKYNEAASGTIQHAVRFTLPSAPPAYTYPGNHFGPTGNKNITYPPYGTRFRLKSTFSETPYTGAALSIVRGLKQYGMFFADQGSAMYISGTSNPSWSSAISQINSQHPIDGSAFEAVLSPYPVVRGWTPATVTCAVSTTGSTTGKVGTTGSISAGTTTGSVGTTGSVSAGTTTGTVATTGATGAPGSTTGSSTEEPSSNCVHLSISSIFVVGLIVMLELLYI